MTEGERREGPRGTLARWAEGLGVKDRQARAIRTAAVVLAGALLVLSFVRAPVRPDPLQQPETPVSPGASSGVADAHFAEELAMEARLERVLAAVDGVREARVDVTLAQGTTRRYAREQRMHRTLTTERDAEGGSRDVEEQESSDAPVLLGAPGGGQQPLVEVASAPRIAGVLVVASGAEDEVVRAKIVQAVATALDVPVHRVTVLFGEGATTP